MQQVSQRALLTRGLGLEVRSVRPGEVSCEERPRSPGKIQFQGEYYGVAAFRFSDLPTNCCRGVYEFDLGK